jgi:hypothetical protein
MRSTSLARVVVVGAALVACREESAATPPDGVYLVKAERARAGADTVKARVGGRSSYVVLGARVTPTRAVLYSVSNGNDRYMFRVTQTRTPTCADGVLVIGTSIVRSTGVGSDLETCNVAFEIDAPIATTAGAMLKVTRQDRAPVGESVTGSFVAARTAVGAGESAYVVLTLTNPSGAAPVIHKSFGAEAQHFSFRVKRNGSAVPLPELHERGGFGTRNELAPGAQEVIRAEIPGAGSPGHYIVDCTYATELSPLGTDTMSDAQLARVWDRTFTGQVSFDVN